MQDHHFLTDIAIILGASFPLLIIGRRFKLPEVISYLITGIIIGPHALRLIDDSRRVEQIAEIGVALILFFIGLHIPFERLRQLGKTAFVAGSLQMALTIALTAAVALATGLALRQGIFYGALVALGSTAVVLPIIASREEMGAPFSRRFLGVSLFQDFVVIPLIMLVPAFAIGASAVPPSTVVTRVAAAVVGVAVLVLIARVVVPRLFEWIAALRSREIFTAAAIVLIVLTIAVARQIGVSAALAAFAAGVVIGDTDFIHQIEGVLRPFRDFLSALFFASMGMLLQPGYLVRHLPLVAATLLAVLLIKLVAAYPAFRAAGAVPRTSLRAAFAIAPVGEFSFLLAQEGKRHGVLLASDEQLFIAVAVVTLAATPLLVGAGKRVAERLHTRVVRDEAEDGASHLSGHIVIIGFGLNGQNVTRVLGETGIKHVVVEEDPERAAVARRGGSRVVVADAGDPEALQAAGVRSALAAVIAISDPDGTRRIVQTCRTVSEHLHILVRTRYISEVEHLRRLGANEVIPEEFETSLEIVSRLLRILSVPGNIVAAQLRVIRDEGYRLLRDPGFRAAEGRRLAAVMAAGTSQTFLVMPGSEADGCSLTQLRVADDHVMVPALIRDGRALTPAPLDEPLRAGDTLFLVGAHDDLLRVTDRLERAEEKA